MKGNKFEIDEFELVDIQEIKLLYFQNKKAYTKIC